MTQNDDLQVRPIQWKVEKLAEEKRAARLHLPDLQRGFRWNAERVRVLFDSLYRRYPVGALLLWKPSWEGTEAPFKTRPWDLWPSNVHGKGEREAERPVQPGSYFILDGQQRLTSLFRVLFGSKGKGKPKNDPDLLVALSPDQEWADQPFWLQSNQLRTKRGAGLLVSAEVLFAGVRGQSGTAAIRQAISEWVKPDQPLFNQAMDRADFIRQRILGAEISAYEIEAAVGDDRVIEIFARLNQQGITLSASELAAARLTGQMANFREQAKTVLSHPEFTGYIGREGQEDRVRTGGHVDTDLLIRESLFLATATLSYSTLTKKRTDTNQTFKQVADVWDEACARMRLSVNFFRRQGVPAGSWLPYRYLLLMPALAAHDGAIKEQDKWLGWALAASLWGHYRNITDSGAQQDAVAANKRDLDTLFAAIKTRAKRTGSVLPENDDLTENVVQDGGVFLSLLVDFKRSEVKSFPSEKRFASVTPQGVEQHGAATNPRIDIHHIFPRALLDAESDEDNSYTPDRIGNLTLLFSDDNESLQDTRPSEYLPKVEKSILEGHLIPTDRKFWKLESYSDFCQRREELLAQKIRDLLSSLGVQ